jgi:hypothetical protein
MSNKCFTLVGCPIPLISVAWISGISEFQETLFKQWLNMPFVIVDMLGYTEKFHDFST